MFDDNEEGTIAQDLVALSCDGVCLGRGQNRIVYRSILNPNKVIKIQEQNANRYWFQNAVEWELYESVKETVWAHWFAKCYSITQSSFVLVQEYVRDLNDSDDIDQLKLPDFFGDFQPRNFGVRGSGKKKQLVCRDAGSISPFMKHSFENHKMIKPQWRFDYK